MCRPSLTVSKTAASAGRGLARRARCLGSQRSGGSCRNLWIGSRISTAFRLRASFPALPQPIRRLRKTARLSKIGMDGSGWQADGVWRVKPSSDSDRTLHRQSRLENRSRDHRIVSVIAREHGGVWAGTNQGLFEIDPDGRLLRRIITETRPRHFAELAAAIDSRWRLWLMSMAGSLSGSLLWASPSSRRRRRARGAARSIDLAAPLRRSHRQRRARRLQRFDDNASFPPGRRCPEG